MAETIDNSRTELHHYSVPTCDMCSAAAGAAGLLLSDQGSQGQAVTHSHF